jgi:hypothetical protein
VTRNEIAAFGAALRGEVEARSGIEYSDK